jgi:hypothetical protein
MLTVAIPVDVLPFELGSPGLTCLPFHVHVFTHEY